MSFGFLILRMDIVYSISESFSSYTCLRSAMTSLLRSRDSLSMAQVCMSTSLGSIGQGSARATYSMSMMYPTMAPFMGRLLPSL